MIETIAGVGVLGFALGWLSHHARRPGPDPYRPMRLVTVNEFKPAGLAPKAGAELGMWELHTISFCWHANMLGSFSYRTLAGAGLVRRAGWETYCGVLREAGVIQAADRARTSWANGYSYSRLRAEVKHGRLRLPFPTGDPPLLNSPKLQTLTTRHTLAPQMTHAHA